MDGEVSHFDYYAQFVTAEIKRVVADTIGKDRIASAIKRDEHLNNIGLSRWDTIGRYLCATLRAQLKAAGDNDSLAGRVCILKVAAKMLVLN